LIKEVAQVIKETTHQVKRTEKGNAQQKDVGTEHNLKPTRISFETIQLQQNQEEKRAYEFSRGRKKQLYCNDGSW